MKHSKKTYDSFQDELEDYIKVQKARGLEPKTCFRKMREDYLETCRYKEEMESRPRYRMFDQRLAPEAIQMYPASCSVSPSMENRLPQWLPAHSSRLRLDSLSYRPYTRDYFSQKPVPLHLSQQGYNYGPCSVESVGYRHLSSEGSPRAYQASHKQSHPMRTRCPEEEGGERPEEGRPKQKRKRNWEDMNVDKQKSLPQNKADVESETAQVSTEKLKNRKEKKTRDVASKKEERKRRKEKKEQGKEMTEEEMLWDQSILGY
ncbi:lysine-rich coiled-coil protein 1 [Ochotona princeps]|uniref:lysine-rich coiled-coil protein 1 n=1 Tax=Ochotona princeps TaxID=9978 RepID=UPI002714FBBD|nr:lysine-rich coiled-coil protein 1 [Ochotona princeps]XP_058523634.1 lysine-rich coiled-coil protein 1 [Ochotona princeps]